MKLFLVPSFLTFGLLAAIAPAVSAADITQDVPMVSLDLPSVCTAIPAPGTLAVDGNQTLDSMATGGSAGTLVVTCNVPSTLSVNQSVTPITGTTITGTTTFDVANATSTLSDTSLLAGINTVDVDLSISTLEETIQPGIYGFNVPVTVTFN